MNRWFIGALFALITCLSLANHTAASSPQINTDNVACFYAMPGGEPNDFIDFATLEKGEAIELGAETNTVDGTVWQVIWREAMACWVDQNFIDFNISEAPPIEAPTDSAEVDVVYNDGDLSQEEYIEEAPNPAVSQADLVSTLPSTGNGPIEPQVPSAKITTMAIFSLGLGTLGTAVLLARWLEHRHD